MGKFLCDRLILFDFYLLICILFAMKEKHRSDKSDSTGLQLSKLDIVLP